MLIANKFNDYFSTIGSVINNKIPSTNGSYKDNSKKKDKDGHLLINCNNSLFLSPTNLSEIENIINSLDANKSTGPNSIPVFILKILKPFFSFWLTQLTNLSFEVSTFPDLLKTAKIASIHKKGFMCEVSVINILLFFYSNPYNLRYDSSFKTENIRTVAYGSETLSFRGPQLWTQIPSDIKHSSTLGEFKTKIKSWKPVECKCRICKIFIPGLGFIS